MADTFGSEINVGPPPEPLRKRRSLGAIVFVVLLLIVGAGGALVWLNLDSVTDLIHGVAGQGSGGNASNADVLASAPEAGVSAADFAAFQQQTATALQGATDRLSAQDGDIKRLSDQIQGLTAQVSALTAKLDQAPGRAAAPAAAAAAPLAAAAPRPAPAPARRRAPVDRPAGAISVGGAPLPATSGR